VDVSLSVADKIGILIENNNLREAFGQKARDVAVKYLDTDICARKHAQLYREIMANT